MLLKGCVVVVPKLASLAGARGNLEWYLCKVIVIIVVRGNDEVVVLSLVYRGDITWVTRVMTLMGSNLIRHHFCPAIPLTIIAIRV